MTMYHLISKIIPESKFKNRLRKFLYGKLFLITFGQSIVPLKEDGTVTGKFCRQLFVDYGMNVITEIKGYTKHYNIQKGDIIVDAGAYIGEFTVYASKMTGPNGKVICFEPDKFNLKLLRKNIKLNNLKNIIIIPKGLWNKEDTLKFKNYGPGSLLEKFDNPNNLIDVVKVTTLDKALKENNIKKVNMVKMDIEGSEIEAIKGCKETMKTNNIHFAIASYHLVDGEPTWKKLIKMFNKLGYTSITEYPLHLTTYARKDKKSLVYKNGI